MNFFCNFIDYSVFIVNFAPRNQTAPNRHRFVSEKADEVTICNSFYLILYWLYTNIYLILT